MKHRLTPILALGTMVASLLVVVPGSQAQTTLPAFSEDFEAFTALEDPAGDDYTYTETVGSGTANAYVSAGNISGSGTKIFNHTLTLPSSLATSFNLTGNACELDFWSYSTETSTNANTGYSIGFSSNHNSTGARAVLSYNGATNVMVGEGVSSVGGVVQTTAFSSSIDSLARHWHISACGSNLVFTDLTNSEQLQITNNAATGFSFITIRSSLSANGALNLRTDEFATNNLTIPPPQLSPQAWSSVVGLTDFSVDKKGVNAIARLNSGENVSTFNAQGLGPAAATVDTDCAGFHGVHANDAAVAYVDCVGTDSIEIRSSTLGAFTPRHCDVDITGISIVENPDTEDFQTLTDFGEFAMYATTRPDVAFSFDICEVKIAMATSTVNGQVGILASTYLASADGGGVLAQDDVDYFVQYAATDDVITSICTYLLDDPTDADSNTDYFLVAGHQDSATIVYRTNLDDSTAGWESPSLTSYKVYTGKLGLAQGVGCSATSASTGIFLVAGGTDGQTKAVNLITGATVWSSSVYGSGPESVDLSRDGKWGVSVTTGGGTGYVFNATSGETVCTFTAPSGLYRDVAIDATGQSVWVATSTNITRFDSSVCTTGTPVSTDFDPDLSGGGGDSDGDGDPETSGTIFNPSGTAPEGFTLSGYNFLLGIIFTLLLAAGAYLGLGRSPVAAGVGAGGGFMGAFAFGFFPLWSVLLVVLALATVFVLKFRGSGA